MVAIAMRLLGAVFPWRWVIVGGIGVLAVGGLYVQSLRLEAAQADGRAYKASADALMGDLKSVVALNDANAALLTKTQKAASAAATSLRSAQAQSRAAAATLHKVLLAQGETNVPLAACMAMPLPPDVLRALAR